MSPCWSVSTICKYRRIDIESQIQAHTKLCIFVVLFIFYFIFPSQFSCMYIIHGHVTIIRQKQNKKKKQEKETHIVAYNSYWFVKCTLFPSLNACLFCCFSYFRRITLNYRTMCVCVYLINTSVYTVSIYYERATTQIRPANLIRMFDVCVCSVWAWLDDKNKIRVNIVICNCIHSTPCINVQIEVYWSF